MHKRPIFGIGWIPVVIAAMVIFAVLGTLLTQPLKITKGFTLNGVDGEHKLQDFEGKVVIMMFGFTHCPDVCPTGLATFAATLNQLDEEQLKQTQAIFISVDPDRDNVELLNKYTAYFHPNIMGLTGSKQQIDTAVKNYGGFYRMVELKDSALEYTVDHSSKLYIIDQQGDLAITKYHNTSPKEVANAIKSLL